MKNKFILSAVSFFENFVQVVRPHEWYLVTNIDDFKIHVNAHIARVRILGIHIAGEFFPEVNLRQLEEYLSLHDAEKLIDTPAFRKWMGLDLNGPSLLESLFEHFGARRLPQPLSEVEKFEILRKKLNDVGARISREWLTRNGFWIEKNEEPGAIGKLFMLIEHIADVLDRELDPIAHHELGKSIFELASNPHSADHYVESMRERRILKAMRPIYSQLVQGNTYRDWVHPKETRFIAESQVPLIDGARLLALKKIFATL